MYIHIYIYICREREREREYHILYRFLNLPYIKTCLLVWDSGLQLISMKIEGNVGKL